ncbi:hypothetical protein [Sphingobacterium nematocida]|uniref:hypothetical protein n=1 Tax=Sphingobacterium nematocida TaxID=1513896 RepID=UPI00111691D4|nr:hypothetical protein [Sphingobacterium nematocida]
MKRVDTALHIMTAWLANMRLLSLSATRIRLCVILGTKVLLSLFYRKSDVRIIARLLRQSLLAQQRVINRWWYPRRFAVFTGCSAVRLLGS